MFLALTPIKSTLFIIVLIVIVTVFIYTGGANSDEGPWQLKSFSNDITYGGTVTKTGGNSYRIDSRTNPLCFPSQVRCNKALVSYKRYQQPIEGKVVIFEFDFLIEQYNFEQPPNWWVLFQDWIRIDPNNRKGNRPISTLEVKSYGNKLYLRHKDSAFQWQSDPNRIKQINNGEILIKVGVSYHIRIELTESTMANSGGMAFFVNNKVVSNATYQTKSATQWRENVQEIGLYHDKQFNTDRNGNNSIRFYINNLTRKTQINQVN